ncbi:Cleaved Adhesin Domain [Mariniphaga anaerophila]|uniref:Cleaved Adhesin Domain n=1 Tax=Mariniphaga anaerophila TaxID=1484053 RepID=A0A1M5F741_9BACT|nr:choice-of-anchor J domain-containing protein [Mariniphaga anaerophila]SHF87198.1 Cleaved Adhesin Domain [Mariniphaga anaerophila]
MKNYIKLFILMLAGTTAFSSCQEELVNPDDYRIEYDETKAPELSEVSIVKVSAEYAVLTANADTAAIDRGFLLSESETDFSSAEVISVTKDANVVEVEEDGTYTLVASSLQGQKAYYFKAFATNYEGGTTVSEVQSFTTREGVTAYEISIASNSAEEWAAAGFESIDKDGDGNGWAMTDYDEEGTQKAFVSYSWLNAPLTPENYLVFPELTLEGVDGMITVNVKAGDASYSAETFKVVASDSPITEENCREAEVLSTNTLSDGDEFSAAVAVPSKFEGKKVYIALVHTECTDNYAIFFLGAKLTYAK